MRNFDEFTEIIKTKGIPSFVSYDHDLSDEMYHPTMYESKEAYESHLKTVEEKSGLDCAKFLCEYLKGNPHPPYIVHSQNPVGRVRIQQWIEDWNDSCYRQ